MEYDWQPMTNSGDIRALGKLGEELGELSAVVSRCLIQGIDGIVPDSDKTNKQWLEEELADVMASIDIVLMRFKLDHEKMDERVSSKYPRLEKWLNQVSV